MLIDTARVDARAATALHEAAHAMAYISVGLDFQYISIDNALLIPHNRTIDAWNRAVTAMAGPAAEGIMYHHGRGNDDDVVTYILNGLQENLEFAEVEPEAEEGSDYVTAGTYALAALPISLAIVSSTWPDIERIAQAALGSTEDLRYGQIMELIENKRGELRAANLLRWKNAIETDPAT